MMRFQFQSVLVMTAAVVVAACSSSPPTGGEGSLAPQGPVWITKGSGAFKDEGKAVFYGVGSVNGVKNKSLATQTADNRARAEVGKTFQTYSASLMKDYSRSTTAGDMSKSSEEQDIQNAVKTFSAISLSGVVVVDHWVDSSDGTIYALAKLDLASFKDSLGQAKELNAATRDYVRQNADKAFDELSTEEGKSHN